MEPNNNKPSEKNQHLSWIINIFNVFLAEYGANPAQISTIFSLLAISQGKISFKTYKNVIATQIFKSQSLIDETAETKQGYLPPSSQFVTRRLESIQSLEKKNGVNLIGYVQAEAEPGKMSGPSSFNFKILQDAYTVLESAKKDPEFFKSPIKTSNKYASKFALNAIKPPDEPQPSKEELDAKKREKKVEEAEKIRDAIDEIEELERLENIYEHSARMYKLYHHINQKALQKISDIKKFSEQKKIDADLILRSTGKIENKELSKDVSVAPKKESKISVHSNPKENSSLHYFHKKEQEKNILAEIDSIPLEQLEKKYEVKYSDPSKFTVQKDGNVIDATTVQKDGNVIDATTVQKDGNVIDATTVQKDGNVIDATTVQDVGTKSLLLSIDKVVLESDVLGFMDAFWKNGMISFDIACPVVGDKEKTLYYRKFVEKEESVPVLKEAFLVHNNAQEKTALYFTPHFLPNIQVIKLDDVKKAHLRPIEKVWIPNISIQTSIESYQVWLLIKGYTGERAVLRSNLIYFFGADSRDSGINGRMPCSLNLKYEEPFKTKILKNELKVVTPKDLIEKGLIPASYLEREEEKLKQFEESSKQSRLKENPPIDVNGRRVWPSLSLEISRAPLVQKGKRNGQPDRSFAYSRWAWIALQRGFSKESVIEELAKVCEKRSSHEKRLAYARTVVEKALGSDTDIYNKSRAYKD